MGSHFDTTFYPADNQFVPSCYTHNPYSNVLDYSAMYVEQPLPCQCEACFSASGRHYDEHNESVYSYSEVQSEEPMPELPSVPTQECAKLDAIDRPTKYIFIGQLPFLISDDKINWLVREFGGASHVYAVEAIWKANKVTDELQHKGCAHVLVPRDEVLRIVNNLHHHILMHHDVVLYGESYHVEHWAGRAFQQEARVASNALVCEGSARQVRKL